MEKYTPIDFLTIPINKEVSEMLLELNLTPEQNDPKFNFVQKSNNISISNIFIDNVVNSLDNKILDLDHKINLTIDEDLKISLIAMKKSLLMQRKLLATDK
jgi:hypothetical protein